MNVHVCGPLSWDRTCRHYGVSRIHGKIAGRSWMIAYWPTSWWPNKTLKIDEGRLVE